MSERFDAALIAWMQPKIEDLFKQAGNKSNFMAKLDNLLTGDCEIYLNGDLQDRNHFRLKVGGPISPSHASLSWKVDRPQFVSDTRYKLSGHWIFNRPCAEDTTITFGFSIIVKFNWSNSRGVLSNCFISKISYVDYACNMLDY